MGRRRTTRPDASKKGEKCFILVKSEEEGEDIRKGKNNQRKREEKGTEMEKKMGISAGRSLRLRGVYDGMRGREI